MAAGARAARRAQQGVADAAADQAGRQTAARPRLRAGGKRRTWTVADQFLVDEANSLLNGTPFTFGHVVVDEAQDHSAVALRVIGRRSPQRVDDDPRRPGPDRRRRPASRTGTRRSRTSAPPLPRSRT